MTLTYQPPTPHRWHFDNRAILPLRNPNFWKIESGVVKTSTWLEDGTLIVLGLWGPGNFVGKTLERVNPYQVECITPVQAVSFSTVESYQMAEILLSHLQQAQELSIIRSYKRTDVMVVKLLSWLGNQFGKQTGTGQLIDVRLTHQDIADLLGTTRVTITRALNSLEQQGAVERLPVHRLLLREEEIWHYEIQNGKDYLFFQSMNWLVALLITSVTSFVATNLDDLMVLMLFFSRLNANFRPRHLIIGQYLGFTLILLASSLGLLFGLLVSKEWIGLLGFIPLIIGIKQLLSRENEDYIQEVREDVNYSKNRSFVPRFPSQTYYIAAVTVANGGDNIGIYTSLFANNSPMHVLIIMIVFYLMMGIWCLLAYFLITHPRIAKVVTNYGHKISPFIYIFLGIYILVDSRSYRLFLMS